MPLNGIANCRCVLHLIEHDLSDQHSGIKRNGMNLPDVVKLKRQSTSMKAWVDVGAEGM